MVVIGKGEMVEVRERGERGGDKEEERKRMRVVGEELASWCEINEGVMIKGES